MAGWKILLCSIASLLRSPLAEAQALVSEGWKWIEVATDLPYGFSYGLRRVHGEAAAMSEAETVEHTKLLSEYRALDAEWPEADAIPEDIDARLAELAEAMEGLEGRPMNFDPVEITRAGIFVTLTATANWSSTAVSFAPRMKRRSKGRMPTSRRAGRRSPSHGNRSRSSLMSTVRRAAVITSGGQPFVTTSEDDDDGVLKPLSERLVMELTAHRTLAPAKPLAARQTSP